MKIVEINKEKLNNFLNKQKYSQFLQSWEWGEFQEKMGNKIFRFALRQDSGQGIEESGEIIAVATLIKKALPFGKSYFYCPRGPIISLKVESKKLKDTYRNLFNGISEILKQENVIFLRFEPIEYKVESLNLKAKKTIDVQPSKTLILDLNKSEEELLKNMHQKTRYNIRLSEKKSVKIKEGGSEDFEKFWQIIKETKERDKFGIHEKKYYEKMLETDFIKLYLAEFDPSIPQSDSEQASSGQERKIIAGNIVSFFGNTATYVHGASSNEYRNVMAPYLLQWEVIKIVQEKGYKYYDFYGIDEKKWPGVTRFKLGFSGNIVEYPGTFDLAFDNLWYNMYKVLRKIRRLV